MKTSRKAPFFCFLLLAGLALQCDKNKDDDPGSPTGPVELKDSVIATGLTLPWEITWGPDDWIWMTTRNGQVNRLHPGTGVVTPVYTVNDVVARGEGGLLGMAVHAMGSNLSVYLVYNYTAGGNYREKLVRYDYNGTTLVNPRVLLENIVASNIHNGSRLLVVNDKLFISTGDADNTALAQQTGSLNGKILRLNLDGTIPADNPLAGNPYWSMGHRNAQGLVWANDRLYSSEHGPSNDDEVNIISKGSNYGWPVVQGFCNTPAEQTFCTTNNVIQPIQAWTPTIAPSGLDYYNSDLIPQWKNSLLLSALKDARIYQLRLSADFNTVDSTAEFLTGEYGRLRDLCISPDGRVFVCTSNGSNDKVIMITKAE